MSAPNSQPAGSRRRIGWRWLLLAAVLLAAGSLAAAAALSVDDGEPRVLNPGESLVASTPNLRSFAASLGHPLYWAGQQNRMRTELTQTTDGSVYVRYLPPGVRAGDRRSVYLTVGTYPSAGAYAKTVANAKTKNAVRRDAPGGGVALWYRAKPTSVYLAYPALDYLIEVYHPQAETAQRLALDGSVGPIR